MRLKYLSTIILISLGTTAYSAGIPKAPQSPLPATESGKAPGKNSAKGTDYVNNKVMSLGNITTEVEGDLTIITARLNKSPDWKEIALEEHGTFLQIKLPQTQIPASGEFLEGNGPFLRKMATFQLPEEDGALRLFLNQDAAKAKLATTAELLGDRVIITIDHKKLEQLIAPPAAKVEPTSADEIIAKTTVDKGTQAPSDIIAGSSKPSKETVKEATPGFDLQGQVTKVAAFCGGLFILLIGAHIARLKRRKVRSNFSSSENFEPVAMRVLSNISIGQKQKLTLVQVGGQQILLGVGPESINLITTIESRSKQSNFAGHLQAANPNAEIRLKAPEEISPPRPAKRTMTASNSTTNIRVEGPIKGGRVNIGVGEDGPRNMNAQPMRKDDDITRLLRDRLRNLPPG